MCLPGNMPCVKITIAWGVQWVGLWNRFMLYALLALRKRRVSIWGGEEAQWKVVPHLDLNRSEGKLLNMRMRKALILSAREYNHQNSLKDRWSQNKVWKQIVENLIFRKADSKRNTAMCVLTILHSFWLCHLYSPLLTPFLLLPSIQHISAHCAKELYYWWRGNLFSLNDWESLL